MCGFGANFVSKIAEMQKQPENLVQLSKAKQKRHVVELCKQLIMKMNFWKFATFKWASVHLYPYTEYLILCTLHCV